jgi:hypothetical protein
MIFAVASAGFSLASNIYVAQNTTGGDTGADCADAHSAAWFNSPSNWGSGGNQIGPGTTVHLCGTFTGSAGSTMLNFQGSGASGQPITLLFEANAVLAAPYWSTSTGAISCNSRSNIVVDGGSNGVVKNTDNGTAKSNQQDSLGLFFNSCDNLTVQNLTVQDIYVRVEDTAGGTGFNSEGIELLDGNNILVTHTTITNVKTGIGFAFTRNSSNFEVASSTFTGVEVPIIHATASANTTYTKVLLHDNDFAGGSNLWDDPAGNSFHHEAYHGWAQVPGAHINGVKIYSNYVHGIWGNDQAYFNKTGGTHITTFLYPEQTGGDVTLFNNVIDSSANGALNQADNGDIFCKATSSPGMSCAAYNNTFIGPGGKLGVGYETDGGPGHIVKNNVFYNVSYAIYTPGGDGNVVSDYNTYYGVTNWGSSFESFSQWQAAGQDAHGQNGKDPKLNPNGTLQAGSSAIGAATNLTNLGLPPLDSDKAGVARPSNGNWDASGYQYSTDPPPNPPTGLSATVN